MVIFGSGAFKKSDVIKIFNIFKLFIEWILVSTQTQPLSSQLKLYKTTRILEAYAPVPAILYWKIT